MRQKGLSPIVIFILIIVLAVAGYFAYNYFISSRFSPIQNNSSAWKTYTSGVLGYSLMVPPQWYIQQNENDTPLATQDYLYNFNLSPQPFTGINLNMMTVFFPISIQGPHHDLGKMFEQGLNGLATSDTSEAASDFASRQVSYTTISGKHTLTVKRMWNINAPADYNGSWCGSCGSKSYYIDLGNGKIMEIYEHWTKAQSNLENTFDQIISSLKFK